MKGTGKRLMSKKQIKFESLVLTPWMSLNMNIWSLGLNCGFLDFSELVCFLLQVFHYQV